MKEADVVYDCLADLFQRNEDGRLVQIARYAELLESPIETMTDAELVIALRRLIFGAVNKHIARLYGDLDPGFRKVLRNLRIALDRSKLFQIVNVFGDPHLVPLTLDLRKDLPPCSIDELRGDFSIYASVLDNIPTILSGLYRLLLEQERYQRIVPLIGVALLIKELYALGWTEHDEAREEDRAHTDSLSSLIRKVCHDVWSEAFDSYVTNGKRSRSQYETYREISHRFFKTALETTFRCTKPHPGVFPA